MNFRSQFFGPLILLLNLMVCAALAASASAQEAGDGRAQPWTPTPGVTYVAVYLPPAIGSAEIDWYAAVLRLSQAQRQKLDHLFRQYQQRDRLIRSERIAPLMERSAEHARRQNAEGVSAELAQSYIELFESRTEVVQHLVASEQRLFQALSEVLTDAQRGRLDRVKWMRTRRHATPFLEGMSPGADLDLSIQIIEMDRDQAHGAVSADRRRLAEILIEYEQLLTTRVEQLAEFCATQLREGTIALNRARIHEIARQVQTHQELVDRAGHLQDEILSINRKRHRLFRRIHDLNSKYLDTLAEHLSQPYAAELVQWFRQSAYPVVYPNPFDAAPVFDGALEIESLEQDQRGLVNALKQQYVERRSRVSAAMVSEYMDWHQLTEQQGGYDPAVHEQYSAQMAKLQGQRHDAAIEAIGLLKANLNEAQLAQIRRQLNQFERQSNDFRKLKDKLASQQRSWPRPYE